MDSIVLVAITAGLLGLMAVTLGLSSLVFTITRRHVRRRRLARELASLALPRISSDRPRARRGRSEVVRTTLPTLRTRDARHTPGTPDPRGLAFTTELERQGCYVNELSIQRRLN